ncbi:MAG: C10 family peptidase [Dysgonomonas sp.]
MRRILIIGFIIMFVSYSCSNREDDVGKTKHLSEENLRTVNGCGNLSEDEALETLSSFINGFSTTKNGVTEVTVISKRKKLVSDYSSSQIPMTIKSVTGEPVVSVDTIPIYEFIMSENGNEGFALVAGHSLYNDVLAYSENGSLADTTFNEGLSLFLSSISKNISSSIEDNLHCLDNKTKAYWQDSSGAMKVLDETEEYLGMVWGEKELRKICPYDRGNGPWTEFKTYGSPIFTQWGQEAPYNDRVSVICRNGRARVGCVPVAFAQIIAHHRVGSYNWDLLTSSQKILSSSPAKQRSEVSRLMKDIADDLGTSYSCRDNGSVGSTYSVRLLPTLNKMGLSGIYYSPYRAVKSDTIRSNVSKNMPVLVVAKADTLNLVTNSINFAHHVWIIDGLSERYRNYYYWLQGWDNNDNVYFKVWKYKQRGLHIHCNWGWGGKSDGWYRYFTPVNTNYEFYDFSLITQIKPKR